ncbi:MAG: alpha/beta fold hydrolase [Reichenbachiella sp.]|uniref:YheT family hydrolase n=1 Tax=Reichenbachiella sp. TaxID=2184521 RepID=UPI0029666057|nr:alpha/beta fold hydrolase [Reichenbachiella sp.]MDW3209986.1 alpha/beta fold hydrolase [Reichenbachiella sp.]
METIIPSVFFRADQITFSPERMELEDGDFLDLAWLKNDNKRLIIACHGFEGSADRHYIKRSAQYFQKRNWDYLSWSYRGCSPTLNRLPKHYYYGGIEDFSLVINRALNSNDYDEIVLFGFSMGGCLVNKYLGDTKDLDTQIKGGVSFSVSCDLKDSTLAVKRNLFGFYDYVFFKKLMRKFKLKASKFKEIEAIPLASIKTFDDFHDHYTLKYHDIDSIDEFYSKSSCINYLPAIKRPNLIVNALNDPILGPKCYPYDIANQHDFLHLETPKYGSHLGFTLMGNEFSWMEIRAEQFINEHIL